MYSATSVSATQEIFSAGPAGYAKMPRSMMDGFSHTPQRVVHENDGAKDDVREATGANRRLHGNAAVMRAEP